MSDQSRNGFASLQTGTSDANQIDFMVRRIMSGMATTSIVKVVAVHADDDVSPIGTVDVQIMVSQMDGRGQAEDHGTIFGVPYFRLLGGKNAVIMDPKKDDIGICVFSSRDISAVKQNKDVSLPSSRRKFSYADGLFFGGFLAEAPENYIRFLANGDIELKPANSVKVIGDLVVEGDVSIDGDGSITGTLAADTDVTADGVSLKSHVHGGVTVGTGQTGTPV